MSQFVSGPPMTTPSVGSIGTESIKPSEEQKQSPVPVPHEPQPTQLTHPSTISETESKQRDVTEFMIGGGASIQSLSESGVVNLPMSGTPSAASVPTTIPTPAAVTNQQMKQEVNQEQENGQPQREESGDGGGMKSTVTTPTEQFIQQPAAAAGLPYQPQLYEFPTGSMTRSKCCFCGTMLQFPSNATEVQCPTCGGLLKPVNHLECRCPRCSQALTYELTATRIRCPQCTQEFDVSTPPTPPNSPISIVPPFQLPHQFMLQQMVYQQQQLALLQQQQQIQQQQQQQQTPAQPQAGPMQMVGAPGGVAEAPSGGLEKKKKERKSTKSKQQQQPSISELPQPPRRPISARQEFCKRHRPEFKAHYPGKTTEQITQLLDEQWKGLPVLEMHRLEQEVEVARERYRIEKAEYDAKMKALQLAHTQPTEPRPVVPIGQDETTQQLQSQQQQPQTLPPAQEMPQQQQQLQQQEHLRMQQQMQQEQQQQQVERLQQQQLHHPMGHELQSTLQQLHDMHQHQQPPQSYGLMGHDHELLHPVAGLSHDEHMGVGGPLQPSESTTNDLIHLPSSHDDSNKYPYPTHVDEFFRDDTTEMKQTEEEH